MERTSAAGGPPSVRRRAPVEQRAVNRTEREAPMSEPGQRAATKLPLQTRTETLTVPGRRSHPFHLTLERLDVAAGRALDYWNMDGRDLRSRNGGRNGHGVVEFWWD